MSLGPHIIIASTFGLLKASLSSISNCSARIFTSVLCMLVSVSVTGRGVFVIICRRFYKEV
jgi:hypothetical protein